MLSIRWRLGVAITAALCALGVLVVALPMSAHASKPRGGLTSYAQYTSIAASPGGGVWTQLGDGAPSAKTQSLGGAPNLGSEDRQGSIAANPSGDGYYIVTVDGKIVSRGSGVQPWTSLRTAGYDGAEVMGAAVTADGSGLWAVDRLGRVWALGTAPVFGDRQGSGETPTGIVGTPSGKGYYIVEADGGVFAYGDAVFLGSTGGEKPGGHHVTGIALHTTTTQGPGKPGPPAWCKPWNDVPPCDQVATPGPIYEKVTGYWLVADDGGISPFGTAPFYGSTGGNTDDAITSITALPNKAGYAIVHASTGDAEVFTSTGHQRLTS